MDLVIGAGPALFYRDGASATFMEYSNYLSELIGSLGETDFSAENAKEDKIEIVIDGYWLRGGLGSEMTAAGFLDALRSYVGDECQSRRASGNQEGGFFFRKRQGGLSPRILFRTERERFSFPQGRPLIGGKIECHASSSDAFSEPVWRVECTLQVNPTRFVRHNIDGAGNRAVREGQPLRFGSEHLLSRRLPRNVRSEHILDNEDNCILEPRSRRLATPSVYRAYRNSYLAACRTFLEERCREVAQRSGASFGGEPRFNVRTVETYWERAHENPLAYLHSIFYPLMSYGRFGAAGFPSPTSFAQERNAIIISAKLRQGTALKVYAKTNKRVRFEIARDLRKETARHTTTDWAEAISWIDDAAQFAARAVNGMRRYLTPVPEVGSLTSFLQFMDAIYAACPDNEDRRRLLQILAATGAYSRGQNDPLGEAIDHLERSGVLEQSGRRSRRVAEAYQPGLAWLRQRYVDE